MNFIAEHMIACRVGRVVDLRTRQAHETDPTVRRDLEVEIGRERHDLASLLLKEIKPDKRGWDWFYVRRDEHGTPRLHLRLVCLPVNSSYLEHLIGEFKIVVPVKGQVVVSVAFAQDAIEEALAQVNHDITVDNDLRRRLVFFHGIAESFASKSIGEDEKACA